MARVKPTFLQKGIYYPRAGGLQAQGIGGVADDAAGAEGAVKR